MAHNRTEPEQPEDSDRNTGPGARGGGSPPSDQDRRAAVAGPEIQLADLSGPASRRVRRFLAESTVKGGASPADVADLYTSPEVVADDRATAYLDRRYVDGNMPSDWRELQDRLADAQRGAPAGSSAAALLDRIDREAPASTPRSIFDDPEDLDEDYDDRMAPLADRHPRLPDLSDDGRQAIGRHIVAEVFSYGMAPIHTMQLRDRLAASGDERSLQYFDLPLELGERPEDWETLRDRALRVRERLEAQGRDPSQAFSEASRAYPDLGVEALLTQLEDLADRR
jgi:hypothetical protein